MLERARSVVRSHPRVTTAVLSVIGLALVIGTFLRVIPASVFPYLSRETVDLFSHAIAVINTVTAVVLALGWKWIREGNVEKHRKAMTSAFSLILLFLVLYLLKIGGGGTKHIGEAPAFVGLLYFVMLVIHIGLSVISVPVVLYAITLGLTHTPRELRDETPHAKVGRVAAGAWIISLVLGVVTYLILNWGYPGEFVRGTGMG
jgi:putative membrane protein